MIGMSKIKVGLKNVSYLTLGNIISQGIGLIGFYYIARILGPKHYGIYATVGAFVGFFHIFIFTGLSKVIIREGSKRLKYFHEVLEKTIAMRFYFIILAMVLCIISSFFTGYSNQTKLFIIIFSIEIIDIGLQSFLGTIYQATESMKYLAYFSVIFRILFTLLSIIFLHLGFGVLAILLINVLSRFCVLIINYMISKRYVIFNFNLRLNIDRNIIKPAIVFSLIVFINTLAVKVDILMVSFLSTPEDVGIYAIADKIAREGNLLRNIVATAFFPIAVKYFTNNNIKGRNLLSYSFLFFIGIFFCCFILSLFVQDLVILLFGDKYSESGIILKYLLFYLMFSFSTIPFSVSLQATHNEKLGLITALVAVSLNIPLNIILFHRFGLIGIAYSTLVVYLVGSILISFLTYTTMRRQGYIR